MDGRDVDPVTGCSQISPGCRLCYAERPANRLRAMGQPNRRNGFELILQPRMPEIPLRWRSRRRIFVNSMSDLFQKDVRKGSGQGDSAGGGMERWNRLCRR